MLEVRSGADSHFFSWPTLSTSTTEQLLRGAEPARRGRCGSAGAALGADRARAGWVGGLRGGSASLLNPPPIGGSELRSNPLAASYRGRVTVPRRSRERSRAQVWQALAPSRFPHAATMSRRLLVVGALLGWVPAASHGAECNDAEKLQYVRRRFDVLIRWNSAAFQPPL